MRPFRRGFGVGVLAPGWDPMSSPIGVQSGDSFVPWRIPGCAAAFCTNTGLYPQAVAFPADPFVDGDCELPGTANWVALNAAISKDTTQPYQGSRCLRVVQSGPGGTFGAVRQAVAAIVTVGNTYRLTGAARSVDGAAAPQLVGGSGTVIWEGTNSTAWQTYDLVWQSAVDATLYWGRKDNTVARTFEFDSLTCTPLNASQLTDLSGNARHLLQATAAKQPLWVASGSGGVLRFAGDYVRALFTLNQPHTTIICANIAAPGSTKYALDGGAVNRNVFIANATPLVNYSREAGIAKQIVFGNRVGAWHMFSARAINNTTTTIQCDAEAAITGDAGSGNADGITLGAAGDPGSVPANMDCAAVLAFTRTLSDSDMSRIYRWWRRQARQLGVL